MPNSETETRIFEYTSIGRVLFGAHAAKHTGTEAASLVQGRKCLLITDQGVLQAGLIDAVESSLKTAGFNVDTCAEAKPEPSMANYEAVLQVARSKNPDLLVGVGGGSSLDIAKAVSRALTSPRTLEEYLGREFDTPGIPVITIPTTSGTGAEITPDAVVRLPEQRVKSGFYNARASLAIVDPTMTLTLPPRLTAATGVDALAHAIESALSKTATPLTQALALGSISLVSRNLREATFNGNNLEARTNMAWATLIEGFSESNAGDVEAHAVGHVLGGYYAVHHGEACGIALPHCMTYNLPVNTPVLVRIAKAMDEHTSGEQRLLAEKGIDAVRQLILDLGLPTSISEIQGASQEHIPELVELYCTHPDIVEILDLFSKRGIPSQAEATRFIGKMFEPAPPIA